MSTMDTAGTVSIRRYVLMRGWARWWAIVADDLRKEQLRLERLRGSRFGIAVKDDLWALKWQRVEWRLRRAAFAVGGYGLVGMASYGQGGWTRKTEREISDMNRASLHKNHRLRAGRAKRLLEGAGRLACPDCEESGYVFEGGTDYPCGCQEHGIIELEPERKAEAVP